jgi:hypothetical protein
VTFGGGSKGKIKRLEDLRLKEEQERKDVMSEWMRLNTPGISLEKRNSTGFVFLQFCRRCEHSGSSGRQA